MLGGRPERGLSQSNPSTPSVIKRSCQRQTVRLDLPTRRAIAIVPTPSAESRTIRARQTGLLSVRGAVTSLSRRDRSSFVSSIFVLDAIAVR